MLGLKFRFTPHFWDRIISSLFFYLAYGNVCFVLFHVLTYPLKIVVSYFLYKHFLYLIQSSSLMHFLFSFFSTFIRVCILWVSIDDNFDIISSIVAEPYNCFGRRGRKEPEALAAASSKRLFVENQPYVIGGYSKLEFSTYECIHGSKVSQMNTPSNILSMAEKYRYMKETYRKRLAFGKHSYFFNFCKIK